MSLPDEKRRALHAARTLLAELANPNRRSMSVLSAEARSVLKHYPYGFDIDKFVFEEEIADREDISRRWLEKMEGDTDK